MKNNAFRKTLSVLVSVCLLLTCFPALGIIAAAGTVRTVVFSPSVITVPEGAHTFASTDPDGYPFTEYDLYRFVFDFGSVLTVAYTDGTSVDYVYDHIRTQYGDDDVFINPNDDSDFIPSADITLSDQQATDHWEAPGSYFASISYAGKTAYFRVDVVANPITSITAPNVSVIEGVYAGEETDGNNQSYLHYDLFQVFHDVPSLVVSYNDGRGNVTYNYSNGIDVGNGRFRDGFVNANDSSDYFLLGSDIEFDDTQELNHWTVGNTYYVTCTCLGSLFPLAVSIVESPITAISLDFNVTNPEGVFGDERVDGNDTFIEYDVRHMLAAYWAELTVTYRDRGAVTYDNSNTINQFDWAFVNPNDDTDFILFDDFDINDTQWDTHWEIGGPYEFTVSYLGKTTSGYVSIIANPIASISLAPSALTVAEGTFAYTDTDNNGQPFDNYDFWQMLQAANAELTLTMLDDSTVTYDFQNIDYLGRRMWAFVNPNDNTDCIVEELFSRDDRQFDNHWQAGNTYTVVLKVLGKTTNVSVTIAPNPVASIALSPASLSVVEGMYANVDNDNGQPFYNYDVWQILQSQNAPCLTVTYTDNTTAVYNFDNREVNGRWCWVFVNQNDDTDFVTDDEFWYEDSQWQDHWTAGNSYNVVMRVFGKTTTVPVTVTANPVASIALTPGSLSVTEGVFANTDYDNNGQPFDNYDVWRILQSQNAYLTVTYTDSTTAVYDFDNREVNGRGRWVFVNRNDDTDYVTEQEIWIDETQWDTHWQPGNTYNVDLRVFGRTVTVPVTVTANPVASITFSPGSLSVLEGTYTNTEYENGQPFDHYDFWMIVQPQNAYLTVTYTDNTTAIYDFDNREVNGRGHWVFVNRNDDTDIVTDDDFWWDDTQWDTHWQAGSTYNVAIYVFGRTTTVPLFIMNNPIASVALTPGSISVQEGTYSRTDYDTNGQPFDNYDFWQMLQSQNAYLTVTYNDNSTAVYDFANLEINGRWQWCFVNRDDDTDIVTEGDFRYEDDQWDNHWTIGNRSVEINFMGRTTTVDLTITANPVVLIALTPGSLSVTEGSYASTDYDNNGQAFAHYDFWMMLQPLNAYLTVTYSDNSTAIYDFGNTDANGRWQWAFINRNDSTDFVTDDEFRYDDSQWDEHWQVGNTYHIDMKVFGRSVTVPVSVTANPVAAIALTPSAISVPEGTFTRTENNNGGSFEYYDFWQILQAQHAYVTVTYTDNTTAIYDFDNREVNGRGQWVFVNRNDDTDIITEGEFRYDDTQWDSPWTVGNTYNVGLQVFGRTTTVPFSITANPVASIALTPGSLTVQEGMFSNPENGSAGTFDHYDFWMILQAEQNAYITANNTDGSTDYYDFDNREVNGRGHWVFVNRSDDTDIFTDEEFWYEDSQWDEPWTTGNTYNVVIHFKGRTATVGVTITANPVASISLTNSQNNSSFTIYEGQNSHIETDDQGVNYTCYETFRFIFREGNTLTVTYTDNTVKTFAYTNYSDAAGREAFVNVNDANDYLIDRDIRFDDTQWQTHWTLGNTYSATISYSGRSTSYSVSVIANPISGISLNPASFTVVEGNVAHQETDNNGTPYLYYEPWNILFGSNAVLTVSYSDGTSATFYHGQINSNTWGYINQQDETDTIPDHDFNFLEDQQNNHWTVGNNTFDLDYCGCCATVTVTIVSNPITAISCSPSWPYVTEGVRTETRTDATGSDYLYYHDLWPAILNVGSTMTVTYADGRGTVTYTMGLIPMPNGGMQPGFVNLNDPGDNPDLSNYLPIIDPSTTDDYILGNDLQYDDTQAETHWVLGGTYPVTLSYRGFSCTFNLTVAAAPDLSKTVSAESGIVIDKTNTMHGAFDGCVYGFPAQTTAPDVSFYTDRLQVENGMIEVENSPYDQNGYGSGAKIYVFDQTHELIATYVIVIAGDVTGDGLVTNDDYAACRDAALGNSVYGPGDNARFAANDVNNDGVLDALDVRQVKLLLQGKSTTC